MNPPYKGHNNWYTVALFYEQRHATADTSSDKISPVFSLYSDVPGLINCQDTFVALRDPTGYKWAMQYLKDWRHWLHLCKLTWFQEAVATWQSALSAELKANAVAKILEISAGDSSQALPAAKYIAEEGWVPKAGSARGRPSKDEVAGELKRAMRTAETIHLDAERIGLRAVK